MSNNRPATNNTNPYNLTDLYKGFHDRLKGRDLVPSNNGPELCRATRQAAQTLDVFSVTPIGLVRLWLAWALLQLQILMMRKAKDDKIAKDALASKDAQIQRLKDEIDSLRLELTQKKIIDDIDTVVHFIKEEVMTKKVAKEFVLRVGFPADMVSTCHLAVFPLTLCHVVCHLALMPSLLSFFSCSSYSKVPTLLSLILGSTITVLSPGLSGRSSLRIIHSRKGKVPMQLL